MRSSGAGNDESQADSSNERVAGYVACGDLGIDFRVLFEHSGDGMLLVDAQTKRVLLANQEIQRMLGYSEEELLRLTVADLHPPAELTLVMERFEQRVCGEVSLSSDIPFLSKTGTVFFADISSVPIRAYDRDCVFGFVRDVTGRKQAEDRLQENVRQYESLFEHMCSGFILVEVLMDESGNPVDHRLLQANPEFERMTGLRRNEEIGRTSADLSFQWPPEVVQAYYKVALSGEPMRWERFNESLQRYYDVRAYSPREGQFAIVFHDITEYKRTEEALRHEQSLMFALMENLPDSIYFKDLASRFIRVNPAGARILGVSDPAQVVGKTDADYLPAEQAARFLVDEQDIIRTGRPLLNVEEKLTLPDGRELWHLTTKIPLRDDTGRIMGTCGISIDITEPKRAEAERGKLEAQLRQAHKMESVGRLAGGVAHDFNNMLGIILGHAEEAMGQVDPALPLYAELEEIHRAAQHSADLTRQLLAFGRKQTIAPTVLDLNVTVEGMLVMLRRLVGEDVELKWCPGSDLWPVRLDPSQVKQVLANLCINARDAISGVGRITIETGNRSLDAGFCAAHPGLVPGDYVLLAVSDTGCGMDEETLLHLFEPFFTTKETGKGTGLGLATVYGIIKQNNGYINASGKPGEGASFKVFLPRHGDVSCPGRVDGSTMPTTRGRETILLVEDESAILRLAVRRLSKQGYTVLAAGTPGEAIRLAREHTGDVHLLMTDVVMPEMNGLDLANALVPIKPRLKRLFMSGYPANVIARHGVLDEGMHFIQKPFTGEALAAKVRQILDEPDRTPYARPPTGG